jgi:hypothetical protein
VEGKRLPRYTFSKAHEVRRGQVIDRFIKKVKGRNKLVDEEKNRYRFVIVNRHILPPNIK